MTEPASEQPDNDQPAPKPDRPGLGQLAAALAKAQGDFENPKRDREVVVHIKARDGRPAGKYTFKYADLAAVLDAVRKPLSDNGLAVMQPIIQRGDLMFVRSMLVHESGEMLVQEVQAGSVNMDIKDLGGKITYMRRYVLSSLLGIASEEDDDEAPQRGPINDAPRRTKGNQQQAIDNRPQKALPPWSGKPDFELRYDSDHHVYVKLIEGRVLQADSRNMRGEDLTALEEALPQRQAWFNQNGFAKLAEQAARDLRIVSNELLVRSGDLERPADDGAAQPDSDIPESTNSEPTDDSEPDVAPASGEDEPEDAPDHSPDGRQGVPDTSGSTSDGLMRTAYTVHIDVEDDPENVPTSTALTPDELDVLAHLHPTEIVAMLTTPENLELFSPDSAKAVARLAAAVGVELFTAEWFTRAWLPTMETRKQQKRPARKLARLAILCLPLAERSDGKAAAPSARDLDETEYSRLVAYLTAGIPSELIDEAIAGLAAICAEKKA